MMTRSAAADLLVWVKRIFTFTVGQAIDFMELMVALVQDALFVMAVASQPLSYRAIV